MAQASISADNDIAVSATMAERFRAHAELCRRIAGQCWDAEIAGQLEQLARQCLRAAEGTDGAPPRH